jgi:hypothetical protein
LIFLAGLGCALTGALLFYTVPAVAEGGSSLLAAAAIIAGLAVMGLAIRVRRRSSKHRRS